MLFVIIGIVLLFIFQYNQAIDTKRFITDAEPYFRFLMESDYKFYLNIKYNGTITDEDVNKLYTLRIRNALITIAALFVLFLSKMSFVYFLIIVFAGYAVFKSSYLSLKKYYKFNLHQINLMLPYYLKSLEILIQHYTVPVALSRSIETAPDIFKPGLKNLISKIDAGDSSV